MKKKVSDIDYIGSYDYHMSGIKNFQERKVFKSSDIACVFACQSTVPWQDRGTNIPFLSFPPHVQSPFQVINPKNNVNSTCLYFASTCSYQLQIQSISPKHPYILASKSQINTVSYQHKATHVLLHPMSLRPYLKDRMIYVFLFSNRQVPAVHLDSPIACFTKPNTYSITAAFVFCHLRIDTEICLGVDTICKRLNGRDPIITQS